MARWIVAGMVCALGCGSQSTAENSQLCEPYLEEHRRFVGWAVRTLAADPGRTREGLQETLFSPLFLESGVAFATVQRGERSYSLGDAPELIEAETVRVDGETLQVTTMEVAGEELVVLISERGTIRVTVGYRQRVL